MAITILSELQTALLDRLNRTDISGSVSSTATVQLECIALAEAEMQRLLDSQDMVTKNAAFSITGEYVATPTDLLEVRDFYLNTSPKWQLSPMPSADQSARFGSATGQPGYYAIEGANFRFGPVPASTYTATLIYLAKFTALSGGSSTNWLLTAHPDAYLNGAIKYACMKIEDFQRASIYDTLFQTSIAAINAAAAKARYSGPGMAVRVG